MERCGRGGEAADAWEEKEQRRHLNAAATDVNAKERAVGAIRASKDNQRSEQSLLCRLGALPCPPALEIHKVNLAKAFNIRLLVKVIIFKPLFHPCILIIKPALQSGDRVLHQVDQTRQELYCRWVGQWVSGSGVDGLVG